MKKLMIIAVMALAGCSSQASRMADCQAQGISRNTCYMAEQNRQNTINAAAEAQALHNAAQLAQAAHKVKPFVKHVGDVEIKRDSLGIVSIDGKPAAEIENEGGNASYEAGIFIVTIYKSGKVALMKDRVFVDFAK